MTEGRVDTREVLSRVDIVEVIDRYVPLAKSGAEYEACCPFHTEDSPSFKVTPSKQFYHCFGCGANGDAIKFLQEYQGLSFRDAVKALGGDVPAGEAAAPVRAPAREKKAPAWVALPVAAANAPERPKAHLARGLPESVWTYRDAEGLVIGHVYRFRTSTGGKEVLPLVWGRNQTSGVEAWRWMAFAELRPLYGLDALASAPDATVLVVEGEKCRDAAAAVSGMPMVVVSWPGGGKAVKKVDWSPLKGRKVVLWADCDAKRVPLTKDERDALPDDAARAAAQDAKPLLPEADQPGVKTMAEIAVVLLGLGCRVWNVTLPEPGAVADGWDVADAAAEWPAEQVLEFMRANTVPFAAAGVGGKSLCESEEKVVSTPRQAAAGGGGGDFSDGGWRGELIKREERLIDCRENVYLMLRHHPMWVGVLAVNEFAREIVKRRPAPWDDPATFRDGAKWCEDDDLRLGLWLAQQERLLVRSADVLAASVGWVARETPWHPVREYLDALAWDGEARIDHWLTDFLGVKASPYTQLGGRFFLIGMVARIYEPGCQMRSMPILEGTQFRGKSTALRILGGEWFSDALLDLNSKDAYQLIQGKWLYEIGELDAFNRAESTRIKAFVSSREDRFRAPYDRAPRDWLRCTVFTGTTNQDEYFKDQTGNTRYWPWRVEEVESINLDGLQRARDQLFAEALALYRRGERWHPTREEQKALFEPEQSDREIQDLWQPMIARWLRARTSDKVTASDIIDECLKIEPGKIDSARQMSTRIGIAMKRLGWIKRRETGGDREYFYERPAGWALNSAGGGSDASF